MCHSAGLPRVCSLLLLVSLSSGLPAAGTGARASSTEPAREDRLESIEGLLHRYLGRTALSAARRGSDDGERNRARELHRGLLVLERLLLRVEDSRLRSRAARTEGPQGRRALADRYPHLRTDVARLRASITAALAREASKSAWRKQPNGLTTVPGPGAIAGRVTDSSTGDGIAGVDVLIFASDASFIGAEATDATGNYATGLVLGPGTYYALTHNSGLYVDELYDDVPCPGGECYPLVGTPIAVSSSSTTDVDFALDQGGVVSGRVTDGSTGLGIPGVLVAIADSSGYWLAMAHSDGSGNYATEGGIPAGSYYAVTRNHVQYVDELFDDLPCADRSCCPRTGTPVVVAAGATTGSIDFLLDKGGVISGRVTDSLTGDGLADVGVEIYDSRGSFVTSGHADESGNYMSDRGLLAGTYHALAWNWAQYIDELYADVACPNESCDPTTGTPIVVTTGSTTSEVDFALTAGASIAGAVTDGSTALGIAHAVVEIYDSTGSWLGHGYADASGNYETESGLVAGTYYAKSETEAGYVDQLFDGVPCPGESCDPTTGAPIALTSGSSVTGVDFPLAKGTVVSGTVTDSSTSYGIPEAGVDILDSAGNWVARGRADGTGSFTTEGGIPAGTYYAKSWNWAGYVDELYPGLPCPGESCDPTTGTSIVVTSIPTIEGIDLALEKGGAIAGAVTDGSTSSSLGEAGVDIFDSSGNWITWGLAGSCGDYSSEGGIPTGSYYARSWNRSHYVDELYDDIRCPGGACDPATGTPIEVVSSSTTGSIDLALDPYLFDDGFESGHTTAWSSAVPTPP